MLILLRLLGAVLQWQPAVCVNTKKKTPKQKRNGDSGKKKKINPQPACDVLDKAFVFPHHISEHCILIVLSHTAREPLAVLADSQAGSGRAGRKRKQKKMKNGRKKGKKTKL